MQSEASHCLPLSRELPIVDIIRYLILPFFESLLMMLFQIYFLLLHLCGPHCVERIFIILFRYFIKLLLLY